MKLEEAIEIKKTELAGTVEHSEEELSRADLLSIEAMNLVDLLRSDGSPYYPNSLLGETED